MRIGIDARFYGEPGQGLARYTDRYIEWLCNQKTHTHSFVIFVRTRHHPKPRSSAIRFVQVPVRWYTLAEQFLMPWYIARHGIDCMHFLHFNVPWLYRGKFIVTIHDLILLHESSANTSTLHPFIFRIKHFVYRRILAHAVYGATSLIAVSQATKNDITDHFHIDERKIFVIHCGIDSPHASAERGATQDALRMPYLVYVGNAYPHKNVGALIRFFLQWQQQHPDFSLVLVGKDDHFYNALRQDHRNQVGTNVRIINGLSDSELARAYRTAHAYVTASRYEGFSLTPLEALSYGTPVLASDIEVHREVLGDTAVFFDPENYRSFSEGLDVVCFDESLRATLKHKGQVRSQGYSWLTMGERVIKLYDTA